MADARRAGSPGPRQRRRGFARAALEALLRRARDEPAVRTVRASIAPGNTASRDLVVQYGFTPVGEQWDEEDGWEVVFEVSADPAPTTGAPAVAATGTADAASSAAVVPDGQRGPGGPYFHSTRAVLRAGDEVVPGRPRTSTPGA